MVVINLQTKRPRQPAWTTGSDYHRERDVLEIRRFGSSWTVALVRPHGMPPVSLVDFDDVMAAERFARYVADARGDTDVIIRRQA